MRVKDDPAERGRLGELTRVVSTKVVCDGLGDDAGRGVGP